MNKLIILGILLGLCYLVYTDVNADVSISTISASHHFSSKEYNEVHNGICLENRLIICRYENSFYNTSHVLGYREKNLYARKYVALGYTVGFVDGYDNNMFWGSVDISYQFIKNYSLQLSFLPGELVDSTNVLVLGMSYEF